MQDNNKTETHRAISIRISKKILKELKRIQTETNLSRNEIICQYIKYGLNHTTVVDDNSE